MVLIDKLWDDVIAGPQPENGLAGLRKIYNKPLNVKTAGAAGEGSSSNFLRSLSMPSNSPGTPPTPGTPSGSSSSSPTAKKENVWRSVFHPGSNIATKGLGGEMFDKPQPNSPTVYDWLYSGETRSKHR